MGLNDSSARYRTFFAADHDTYLSWRTEDPAPTPVTFSDGRLLPNVSFGLTQQAGRAFFHMGFRNQETDVHGSLGAAYSHLRITAQYGSSEGILSERQEINTIAPNFFHGAVSYPYTYGGATVAYDFSDRLCFKAGNMWITGEDLEDRSVYFGGFDYKPFSGTFASVYRGGDPVGHRWAVAYRWKDFTLAYQQIDAYQDATWQSVTFSCDRADLPGTIQLDFGRGENALFDDVSETRATLTCTIPLGGPKFRTSRSLNRRSARLISDLAASADDFGRLSKTGLGAVGTGLLLSSGSPTLDRSPRFATQNAAAINILFIINPVSVANNREYGSSIYLNRDRSYGYSAYIAVGTIDSVSFNPHDLVPAGTTATAYWHTHGADIPGYLSEQFSTADLLFAVYYDVDGYLGTPQGRAFWYDLSQNAIYQFYGLDGTETFLPH